MSTATAVDTTDRASWLAERNTGIGASEAAAVLGVSPWATPLEVYLRKTGQLPPVETSEAMRRGLRLEDDIAEEYLERVGGSLETQLFLRHPARPWMIATIDGRRSDGRIVEFKAVGWRSAGEWGEEGTDEIPGHYLCQVLHQMDVAGTDVVDVAALIGGSDFRVYHVERDDAVIDRMVEIEAEFWGRVERQDPPRASDPADATLLRHLYPEATGEVALPDEASRLVLEWEAAGASIRELEDHRKRLECRVREAIGPAEVASLSDGRRLKRYQLAQPERTQVVSAHVRDYLRILKGARS